MVTKKRVIDPESKPQHGLKMRLDDMLTIQPKTEKQTMMEEIMRFAFNEEVAGIVWWYVYERKNANGDIMAWEDEDGTEYFFKTPGDLYELIIYKFDL